MGVADIVIITVCWLVVAGLMLWGVLTEHRRDARRGRGRDWHPVASPASAAHTDWIVLESAPGSGQEVAVRALLLASALLASRGVDLESLPPGDLRTEVTTSSDGASSTRILVRAGAVHASRRRR
jgi:hypothetical protein